MRPEAAFLAGYALALVALAAGLEWLGRRSANPWSSRVLTASRPPDAQHLDYSADWPHSEVPVFHQGVGGVALAAALLLTTANVIRNHHLVELVVLLPLVALIATRILRVVRRLRPPTVRRDSA